MTANDCQHMLTAMETSAEIAEAAGSTDPDAGLRAVAALRPGLPIVGYERGEDLAAARRAGFTVLAPLRIWARGSAVP